MNLRMFTSAALTAMMLLVLAAPSVAAVAAGQVTLTAKESGCPAGKTYCFDPVAPTISPGAVTIQMTNAGAIPHNLCVEGQGITRTCAPAGADSDPNGKTVAPGGSTTLTFNAPASGTLKYWCAVAGHEQLGMVGNMTIQGTGTTPPGSPPPAGGDGNTGTRGSPSVGVVSIALGAVLLALVLRRK